MRTQSLLALAPVPVLSHPGFIPGGSPDAWEPAGPNDFRGPCPMMNTLANHGFIPHDGKNLTRERLITGLNNGLNFNEDLANVMFDQALIANTETNATWFDLVINSTGTTCLNMMPASGIVTLFIRSQQQTDSMLSRSDAYFGNNHVFNQTIFDETRAYWEGPIINASMLGNSKIARQLTSKSTNPTYKFTNVTENFSLGELLAPIIAFGDAQSATVRRDLVEYFFENERLPTRLGWTKRAEPVLLEDILRLLGIMSQASSLITEQKQGPVDADIHSPPS